MKLEMDLKPKDIVLLKVLGPSIGEITPPSTW